jgi:hypothetical protein
MLFNKTIYRTAILCFLLSFAGNSTLIAMEKSTAVTSKINDTTKECIILLHGLARTKKAMSKMASVLNDNGYHVVNVDYPSRSYKISYLSQTYLPPAIFECQENSVSKIHFVSHSMGGILIRHYLSANSLSELGRVVMLSPPNRGSEVVDKLKNVPGFYALNGPAGQELGTDESSMPNKLGVANFDLGIITGNKSINLILSMLIPGDDDGKVSIKRAKLEGMKDFLVMPHSHPFIMQQDEVIKQTMHYLHNGHFDH